MGKVTATGTFLFLSFYPLQDSRFPVIGYHISLNIGFRISETVTNLLAHRGKL